MADNYIERQREQYEARKAAWQQARKYGQKKSATVRPTTSSSYPPMTSKSDAPKRRVFITGGAEGIGKAIVEAFCLSGNQVAFCDINETAGQATAQATGATFHPVDVSDKDALESCMQRILSEWKDIDIIINNVGISQFSPITETSVEDFDQILSINLRPVFITSRLLAIHRKEHSSPNPYGRIINICSTRYLMSEPGSEGYAASKGGIYSLTHALALSLSEWKITVNSIAPGWIQTHDYDQLRPEDHSQHPSRRVGKPEDIARMCLFLCEENNDFINGENITVDGGMTKKMIYEDI
ncbi:SDR family NAD(P)-dependent oxidoreductase [Bacteroides sp. AN502(2024)]|uniref:SDR family NAD(P)-dependent oxidoreductase n=1 Tax=Bacteroides sp. AN502(2024) TaxID=3160599 RepID=UPI0035134D42